MRDIEIAINNLEGHTICLCKDGEFFTDDGRGISPMMKIIAMGQDVTGYAVADQVVGKAAAMLFVKCGIIEVHGKIMSRSAEEYLSDHNITHSCDNLIDKIVNREGTDMCPMEKTVLDIQDEEEGYVALKNKIEAIRAARN